MAVRPSRVTGMVAVAGMVVAGLTAGPPAVAQDQDQAPVAIAGSVPAWATPAAKVGDVADGDRRHVQVALALRDPRGAEALAKAVSTPGSPQFRKFLSGREFADRFAATPQTVERVSSWLHGQGLTVTGVSNNRHFIEVSANVGRLEAAFGVRLSKFSHSTKAGILSLVAPETAISVPRGIRGAVQAVLGLHDSARTATPQQAIRPADPDQGVMPAAPGDPLSCARFWGESNNAAVPQKYAGGNQSNVLCGYNTPQTRAIYGLSGGNTGAGSTVAIVGAYNLPTIVVDTNLAASHFGSPPLAAGQYSAVLPGSFDRQNECGPDAWNSEQAEDVQGVHTIAPAARIIYYGAKNCFELFGALNQAVSENRASVISNSWSSPGESAEPPASRQQMDSIALQAATQGQALLFITGDVGDNRAAGRIEASFPASHPWVTSVGGTSVALDSANRIRFTTGWENAGNTQQGSTWVQQQDADGPFAGGAGGGVSVLYGQPDYQRGVVPDAVARGKRATPDIAALADSYTGMAYGFTTSQNGYVESSVGGTSLAGPIMAGLVADAQQAQGVARLGFLNTAIYALAGKPSITDVRPVGAGMWTPMMATFALVTVPTQPGSYLIDLDTKPQSLQSAPGWDPVTGVGTPNSAFLTAIGK